MSLAKRTPNTALGQMPSAPTLSDEYLDIQVVILNNYIRGHHVDSYRELAKRVRKLTILLSVPMEPDRNWTPDWADLDVRIQRNWMLTSTWKHPNGFNEPNFIHIPIDTSAQLKSLKPDVVFSYEMGMRTLLSSWFRRFHRSVPLVMVGNMSDCIEKERGILRKTLRWFIRRGADYFTYNGPSCKRYLKRIAIPDEKLFHLPYCLDSRVVFRGERVVNKDDQPRRLVYCGSLSKRKGILEFAVELQKWCDANPDRKVELTIAGDGPLRPKIAQLGSQNCSIELIGNCDFNGIRTAYQHADLCVYPSFADEWGLVPIEAMASGLPVLGSTFAQSVETVVTEGENGWLFDPTDSESMLDGINRAMNCDSDQLITMGQSARDSVADISADTTARKFCNIIKQIVPALKTIK